MRRFQYFIDFDGTVRIDNKDDDYPAGNTPWPKLFGIFNSFCNIFFKHSQIIRLALFKTSRGSYFRDIGKIVFHRLSVRNFFAPFRRGLKRIDSGQRRAKQLQCPSFTIIVWRRQVSGISRSMQRPSVSMVKFIQK